MFIPLNGMRIVKKYSSTLGNIGTYGGVTRYGTKNENNF